MTNSTDNKLTYNRILERAKQDALEAMPDFPNLVGLSTSDDIYEAWEAFQQEVEDIDAYEVANESSEWDWVIYYHRAMELCHAVPSDVLHEAESQWADMYGIDSIDDQFGLFELAAQLANLIVVSEIAQAVEQAKEELIDLAQTNMDSFS